MVLHVAAVGKLHFINISYVSSKQRVYMKVILHILNVQKRRKSICVRLSIWRVYSPLRYICLSRFLILDCVWHNFYANRHRFIYFCKSIRCDTSRDTRPHNERRVASSCTRWFAQTNRCFHPHTCREPTFLSYECKREQRLKITVIKSSADLINNILSFYICIYNSYILRDLLYNIFQVFKIHIFYRLF